MVKTDTHKDMKCYLSKFFLKMFKLMRKHAHSYVMLWFICFIYMIPEHLESCIPGLK